MNTNVTGAERDVMSLRTAFLGGKDVQQKFHHIYITWPPSLTSSVPKIHPKRN